MKFSDISPASLCLSRKITGLSRLFKAVTLTCALCAFGSCGTHEAHHHEAGEEEEHHRHGAGEIVLEPEEAARFGVEVERIEAGSFQGSLRVAGEILPSTSDQSVASAPTSGIITFNAAATAGTRVAAGQILGQVRADDVSGGDANRAARAALESAQRELDRITPLLAEGLVTRREYNEALAAVEAARAAYSPAAASGDVKAPRAGVITGVDASNGEFVATGQALVTIAGNTSLTLRALLPASQAAFLSSISGAVISGHDGTVVDISEYGGRKLSSDAAAAAQTPGYIPVFFSFDSSAPVLPGSGTEVYLRGASREGVIAIPAEALVEQMGQKFVFVRHGDHAYIKKPVTTGDSDGRRTEITSGIEPGEDVVVSGATFVRLAEQATVAPEGHSHNH